MYVNRIQYVLKTIPVHFLSTILRAQQQAWTTDPGCDLNYKIAEPEKIIVTTYLEWSSSCIPVIVGTKRPFFQQAIAKIKHNKLIIIKNTNMEDITTRPDFNQFVLLK